MQVWCLSLVFFFPLVLQVFETIQSQAVEVMLLCYFLVVLDLLWSGKLGGFAWNRGISESHRDHTSLPLRTNHGCTHLKPTQGESQVDLELGTKRISSESHSRDFLTSLMDNGIIQSHAQRLRGRIERFDLSADFLEYRNRINATSGIKRVMSRPIFELTSGRSDQPCHCPPP